MSSRAPAPDGVKRVARLSERERIVLRLLARGHDGKSAASALGISPTAVHERLREARRKLDVTSSREAARLLAAAEGDPEFRVGEDLGIGGGSDPLSDGQRGQRRLAVLGLGGLMMVAIVIGAVMLWMTNSGDGYAPPPGAAAPRVVRTFPAQGAIIAPGPFALSVTYDQPMQPGSYSFVQVSADSFPDCGHEAVQSPDRRTWTMRCTGRPGRHYEVWFNSPPYMNFKAEYGLPSQPYQLLFRVKAR